MYQIYKMYWMWLSLVFLVLLANAAQSSQILEFMDRDVKPCDDFYMHSCGNFGKDGKDTKSFPNTLLIEYNKKLKNFLKEDTDDSVANKVKNFYRSCLNREPNQPEQQQQLLAIMEEFGGMPALKGDAWSEDSFDWLQVVGKIMRKYGVSTVVGIEVEPDIRKTDVNRLYIGEVMNMPPQRMNYYYEQLNTQWETELMDALKLDQSKASIVAKEMAEFAKKLSRGVSDPSQDLGLHAKSNLTTLHEMDEKYGPTLNVTTLVTAWLGPNPDQQPTVVYEYVENYLQNLKKVVEETPSRTMANYILWTLLQKLNLAVEESQEYQEEKCFQLTKNYFYKYFDNRLFKELRELDYVFYRNVLRVFSSLRQIFEAVLESPSLSWMSAETKSQAQEKLQDMEFYIVGYVYTNFTELYGSLNFKSNDFIQNVLQLLEVQALELRSKITKRGSFENYKHAIFSPMYLQDYNLIAMPMYFMQPQQFRAFSSSKAFFFGIMGFAIAHEMIHAFDDTGRLYDGSGNFHNWWDRESADLFEARRACVRNQYAYFTHGDNTEMQGENIADISGLRLAYLSYKGWMSEMAPNGEVLADMDNITSQQLFFISAAQMWCRKMKSHHRNPWDTHSHNEVRVQGMIANSEGFAETFKCEVGAPMNPFVKCLIY